MASFLILNFLSNVLSFTKFKSCSLLATISKFFFTVATIAITTSYRTFSSLSCCLAYKIYVKLSNSKFTRYLKLLRVVSSLVQSPHITFRVSTMLSCSSGWLIKKCIVYWTHLILIATLISLYLPRKADHNGR